MVKGCKKLVGIPEEDFAIQCGDEMDDGRIFYCVDCTQKNEEIK